MPSLPRLFGSIAVVTLCVLAAGPPALAQESRGEISGRVVDESGGVLPGVAVTATNIATNTPSNTTTNETGAFRIPYLAPGQYTSRPNWRGSRSWSGRASRSASATG